MLLRVFATAMLKQLAAVVSAVQAAALAWTAFALLGWLVANGGIGGNQIDKGRLSG